MAETENRNNHLYQANPQENPVFNLQYDGFTSTTAHPWLTATLTVQAGNTYHIKFVIADEDDYSYDSAVFIKPIRTMPCQ